MCGWGLRTWCGISPSMSRNKQGRVGKIYFLLHLNIQRGAGWHVMESCDALTSSSAR